MDDFWDVASCSLVEIYRCFKSTYCLHLQSSEMSVTFYATALHNILEDSHFHTRPIENQQCHWV
jgi:hypothetical protein